MGENKRCSKCAAVVPADRESCPVCEGCDFMPFRQEANHSSTPAAPRLKLYPGMAQVLFGTIRVVEATLIYLLAFAIARHLKTPIPGIGSGAYIIFVVLWPVVIRPILGPGLKTIPIIGDILDLLDLVAGSGFRKSQK